MWSSVCENYIPIGCYLVDIEENLIDRGTIVQDEIGYTFKFEWDGKNQEWVAISLKEDNRRYPMYQERVNENRMKIIEDLEEVK